RNSNHIDVPPMTTFNTQLHHARGHDPSIGRYLGWYNGSRPHSSLDRRTPDQAYFNNTPLLAAA
ncbi:hypothetical protein, partial [Pinisolibacter aquiterrae]